MAMLVVKYFAKPTECVKLNHNINYDVVMIMC